MSVASGLPAVGSSVTAITATDPQHVASIIEISLVPGPERRLVVHPETVEAYYTHHGGAGNEMKSHRLLWLATFAREPGDTILIRVTEIHHPDTLRATDPAVSSALRAKHAAWPRCTWVIEHDQNAVETEPISFATDRDGRINFKYDVVLTHFEGGELASLLERRADPWDRGRRIGHLDPGGNLIPDP